MNRNLYFIILALFLLGCKNNDKVKAAENYEQEIALANEFVDAFYSFNQDVLKSTLEEAKESQPNILYYQKWAECGNYKVIDRAKLIYENDSMIICPVTVKDDLMAALHIDFNVTDTFRLTIQRGKIQAVSTSSNDPDLYYTAKNWVKENRNELIEIPCQGIWEGGPTPCDCIKSMIKGFGEFNEVKN